MKTKEELKAYYKEYRKKNSEKMKNKNKKYYENNTEKAKLYYKEYHRNNKERENETHREYYNNNKEKYRNVQLKKMYGMTNNDYQVLFNKQEGNCAICDKHQSELSKALAVDHNHDTGEVRGLLCSDCNSGIGLLKENKNILLKAIQYLK